MKKQNITLGLIIGNRDFFPDILVSESRTDMLKVFEEQGIKAYLLPLFHHQKKVNTI